LALEIEYQLAVVEALIRYAAPVQLG